MDIKIAQSAKTLNQYILGDKFEDKDINEYIYASLTQPPIRIVNKNNCSDEIEFTVECPNCHSYVCYGTDIFMLAGHIYCSNEGCRDSLINSNQHLKDIYG